MTAVQYSLFAPSGWTEHDGYRCSVEDCHNWCSESTDRCSFHPDARIEPNPPVAIAAAKYRAHAVEMQRLHGPRWYLLDLEDA